MPTTYTLRLAGPPMRGLSAAEAAHEMLTYDGWEYAIRRVGGQYRLEIRNQTAGRPWGDTIIYSLEDDEAAATAEIYQRVVDFTGRDGGSWAGDCMTDESYDRMMADLALNDE